MTLNRLPDYLDHMRQAVADDCYFFDNCLRRSFGR